MRDVRDWNKYVDLVGKAVSKRAQPPARPDPGTNETGQNVDINASLAPDGGNRSAAASVPPDAGSLLRKGRGPRKEETREELLSRLLDPTLTLEETARILEVCPTTVRRYTNKGILPHERSQGNQRRFKLSRVLEFRDAQVRGETGEEVMAE